MVAELRGCVPAYSALLARTHVREAWVDIRNLRGWSFQLGSSGFATPSLVNGGTCTVTLGSNLVQSDATAQALWLAASTPVSLITQRQFRVGAGTIYNIIAMDGTTGELTLDRPYIDLTVGSGIHYSIYQCYYPVPVDDFEAWEDVLDTNNVIYLNVSNARGATDYVNRCDPQRQIFSNPLMVIPHGIDDRPGSATFGRLMMELYPQPQAQYVYSTWFSRMGPDLTNPSDTLPFPITESLVKAMARVRAYEWCEGNKDSANPRGNGADFRFLIGAAQAQAQSQLKEIRSMDRDRVDMWRSTMTRISGVRAVSTFDPATGMVSSRNM